MCQLCQEAEESEMGHSAADESENTGNFKPRVTCDSAFDTVYVISTSYCSPFCRLSKFVLPHKG